MNGRAAGSVQRAAYLRRRRDLPALGRYAARWTLHAARLLPVVLAACGADGGGARVDPFAALPVARRAPARAFDLERLDGGRLRLEEYRGRVTLVNIWASWCGPCREEMPALAALARDLGDSAVAFVTLNDDVERDRAAAFAAELAFPYPVGLGGGRLRGRHYGFGLPFTMLLDPEGRVMYRWYGFGGDAQLAAIRRMVAAERRDRGTAERRNEPLSR